MTARRPWTVAVAVTLAVLAACSDGDDSGGDGGPPDGGAPDDVEAAVTLEFVGDTEPSDDDLAAAVAVVERRIDALDVDATVAGERGLVVVELAADDPAVADEVTAAVEARGELLFRPVLASVPDGELPVTPPGDDDPDAPVELADDAGTVYSLGPAEGTGDMVESAEGRLGASGQSEVALVLRPGDDGIDAFNRTAAACNTAEPTCPSSQLAIVLDSVVQSAPMIQEPAYERDQIIITGNFETQDARELAAVLAAGTLPYPLTLSP
jgi:preprotein translocase subunit SecD